MTSLWLKIGGLYTQQTSRIHSIIVQSAGVVEYTDTTSAEE